MLWPSLFHSRAVAASSHWRVAPRNLCYSPTGEKQFPSFISALTAAAEHLEGRSRGLPQRTPKTRGSAPSGYTRPGDHAHRPDYLAGCASTWVLGRIPIRSSQSEDHARGAWMAGRIRPSEQARRGGLQPTSGPELSHSKTRRGIAASWSAPTFTSLPVNSIARSWQRSVNGMDSRNVM
jgi:hypothetical protein